LHIQYSYDDRAIDVVNSTYAGQSNLHAIVHVYGLAWNELYTAQAAVNARPDSAQRVFTIPEKLYAGSERIFFIDLSLADDKGRVVSHNFYWVPGTLTTFDWEATNYTHTPAARHEDLTALAHLPPAQIDAHAEIENTAHGSELRLHLTNRSNALAFQLRAAVRKSSGGLIAPVLWSDNWIELTPGASTTLTAKLPEGDNSIPTVKIDGWNVAPISITPTSAIAAR